MKRNIKFKGQEFILVGERDGAIATKYQYQHGLCSYAHLYPNGEINRYGQVIGTIKDIEFGEEVEVEMVDDAWDNMPFHKSWGLL